jgi:Icc-related predicted phosphoesterase
MKVIHFSDWHGKYRSLPEADLYVCTGDMLPNFPLIKIKTDAKVMDGIVVWDFTKGPRPLGTYFGRILDPDREKTLQEQWINQNCNFRREYLGNPDAPIVCVRGNHDFTDLSALFTGGDTWEVTLDSSRSEKLLGLKIGGIRGIPYIRGEWSDEIYAPEMRDRLAMVPADLDLFLSHPPPRGILDHDGYENLGSNPIRTYIDKTIYNYQIRSHCFGHIHEAPGTWEMDQIVFSNAATTFNTFTL